MTSESLKDFLGQFGQVMDATVMFDRETGRSKGFAFATFADEEAVGVAMAASGIELEGRQVSVFVHFFRVSRSLRWRSTQRRVPSLYRKSPKVD